MSEKQPRRFGRREFIPKPLLDPKNALPVGVALILCLGLYGAIEGLRKRFPEIEIAHGGFLIKPGGDSPLVFRTSPFAITQEGIAIEDNIVPQDDIYLQGASKPALSQVESFHLSSSHLVRGQVVGDSFYWIELPEIPVLDRSTNETTGQTLYVSLSSRTLGNITPDINTQIVRSTVQDTGYYVGSQKVVRRQELGRITEIQYKVT